VEKVAKIREIRNQIQDWLLIPVESTFFFKFLTESDYSETGKTSS